MKASPLVLAAVIAAGLGVSSAQAQVTPLYFTCDANARDVAMMMLKASTPSEADRATELKAAETAIAAAAKLNQDALAGLEVPQPYSGAAYWAKQAAKATLPELAELYRRVAKDQLSRYPANVAMTRTHWAAGLSDKAVAYAYRIVALDGCGVDEANTAWLKTQLKAHGWYTIPEYGKEADSAAFLLVQHADRDPAFQAEVLPQLEMLALEGKSRPSGYAPAVRPGRHRQQAPAALRQPGALHRPRRLGSVRDRGPSQSGPAPRDHGSAAQRRIRGGDLRARVQARQLTRTKKAPDRSGASRLSLR